MSTDRRFIPLRHAAPPGVDCPLAPPSHATAHSRSLYRVCLSVEQVRTWMEGREPLPADAFEECVEVLLLYTSRKGEA